jgi:hypothetical protein
MERERCPPADDYGTPLKLSQPPGPGYDKNVFLANLLEIERILRHRKSTRGLGIAYRDHYYNCTCRKVFLSPTVVFELFSHEYEWKSYMAHLIQDHDYFPSPRFYELVMTLREPMQAEWEKEYPESVFGNLNPQPAIPGYDKERFLDGMERWEEIRSAACGRADKTTFQCPHCQFMCQDAIQYRYGDVRWFWYHKHLFREHDYVPSKKLYEALLENGLTAEQREKAEARDAKLDSEWKDKEKEILDLIDELHCGCDGVEFVAEKYGRKYRVTVSELRE